MPKYRPKKKHQNEFWTQHSLSTNKNPTTTVTDSNDKAAHELTRALQGEIWTTSVEKKFKQTLQSLTDMSMQTKTITTIKVTRENKGEG